MASIVLVCGGRKFFDRPRLTFELDRLDALRGSFLGVVQGGAAGADTLAREWQERRITANRHLWVATVRADWHRWGNAAGPIRNQKMLDDWPIELVIAFPGNAGTHDMKGRARLAHIEVIEIPAVAAC